MQRDDGAERRQFSSAFHDSLTDRIRDDMDDLTDPKPAVSKGAEGVGLRVGNLVELTQGTSQGHVPRADPPSLF